MAFSLLPREDEYFDLFTQMAGKIEEASKILSEMMADGAADFRAYIKQIKDVEHACDQVMHTISNKLNKSFITPFDREDIYHLAVALDDICDYIDAAGRAVVMYDINEFNEEARSLARIIGDLGVQINGAVS